MNDHLRLAGRLKAFLLLDRAPTPDVRVINVQRILILACVMTPVHLLHVLLFFLIGSAEADAESLAREQWRIGIMLSHGTMLMLSVSMALAAYQLRRAGREGTLVGRLLPLAGGILYLLFGAILCVVDQLVTASINPYLIACVAVGLVLILRPQQALIIYLAAYALLCFPLALTQTTPEILLSMRVNGVSATALGFGLSLVVWRSNMINLLQRSLISAQSELMEQQNEQLRYLAGTDMLTGMNNRFRFMEVIERELARVRRTGEAGALMIMDIDHFKKVNDRYGHPGGDEVLCEVARVIREHIRDSDTAARFGGEEFAVLLPATSREGAVAVAEKLRRAIEQARFPDAMDELSLTASTGLVPLLPGTTDDFDIAYQKADTALYQAKQQGRNRVVIAESGSEVGAA